MRGRAELGIDGAGRRLTANQWQKVRPSGFEPETCGLRVGIGPARERWLKLKPQPVQLSPVLATSDDV